MFLEQMFVVEINLVLEYPPVYRTVTIVSSLLQQQRINEPELRNAGLLKPWGQYIRTDTDGKLKEDL
ncbi:MAG: hypothetical protein NVSMB33_16410 [Ktedonobacteraceae bacterium]